MKRRAPTGPFPGLASLVLASVLLASVLLATGCNRQEASGEPPSAPGERQHEHEGAEARGHEDGNRRDAVLLPAEAQAQASLRTVPVVVRSLEVALTTTGEVEASADRQAHVTGRIPGRTIRIHRSIGDTVRQGEALATLESLELGEAQAAYLEAQAKHDLARTTWDRQLQLFRGQLTAEKDMQAARNHLRVAEIELERARNRLELYGLGRGRIAALAKDRKIDPTLPLAAPIDGVVVARHVTLGERQDPEASEPAFTLWDTSELWVEAVLHECDLARVEKGHNAHVTIAALPGRSYKGSVALISTVLNRETRTAKARIVVRNADRRLKPGMFATVRIATGRQSMLAVPSGAVMREKDDLFVFVRAGPERFEKRLVRTGPRADGFVPVIGGLARGEEVVVAGAFVLKSELLKEQFGEHHH